MNYVKYGVLNPVTQLFFAINFTPLMTHPCQGINLFLRIFLEKEKTTFATFLENEDMIRFVIYQGCCRFAYLRKIKILYYKYHISPC